MFGNSNLANIGIFQIQYGKSKAIPANTKDWLVDWINIVPGTYLVGFTSQPSTGVSTYMKVTTAEPTVDKANYELLLNNSGSAVKIIKVTNTSIVSVAVDNQSSTAYNTYIDPGAYFAWALRVK